VTVLASWNDTATTQTIVAFAESAAKSAPPEERVAVFDNDGTLWCEKPMPIELDFLLQRFSGTRSTTSRRSASSGTRMGCATPRTSCSTR
jgi:hypothetical protein